MNILKTNYNSKLTTDHFHVCENGSDTIPAYI